MYLTGNDEWLKGEVVRVDIENKARPFPVYRVMHRDGTVSQINCDDEFLFLLGEKVPKRIGDQIITPPPLEWIISDEFLYKIEDPNQTEPDSDSQAEKDCDESQTESDADHGDSQAGRDTPGH